MTTTGERLVSISTLTSDTALNHFLNIETGGGGPIESGIICTIQAYAVAYIGENSQAVQYITPSEFGLSYVPDSIVGLAYNSPDFYSLTYIPQDPEEIEYLKCK